jgi:hypothetical protein
MSRRTIVSKQNTGNLLHIVASHLSSYIKIHQTMLYEST